MKASEFEVKQPQTAIVESSERITPPDADEVRHIVLNIPDATFDYIEGQSIGVLAPAPKDFGNDTHFRLYSIASSREGEDENLAQIAVAVRRCFYIDEVSGERYPGIASNFLCDRKPGDEIKIAGPYGRQFQAPRDKNCNLLMIGIGTGIAPFRAFMKHIYRERNEWLGKVRLFYGARTGMDLLYMNKERDDMSNYYDKETFKAFETIARRPYLGEEPPIEETLMDNAQEVWSLVQDPKTYVYVAGLSSLEKKLDRVMSQMAGSEEAWQEKKKELKHQRRWQTLLYD